MLLHAERPLPLGISLQICPVIQVFKHAYNRLVITQRNRIWLNKKTG